MNALFAEFAIPIVKTLDLTLAGRYDDYSDFGNTFNPKIGLRWQPMREVLFRGSYNTGFRAPTLYEIYQPPSLTFTTDNYDDPVLCPGGNPVPGASAGVVCGQQVLQRESGPAGIGLPAEHSGPRRFEDVHPRLRLRADAQLDVRYRLLEHQDREADQRAARAGDLW